MQSRLPTNNSKSSVTDGARLMCRFLYESVAHVLKQYVLCTYPVLCIVNNVRFTSNVWFNRLFQFDLPSRHTILKSNIFYIVLAQTVLFQTTHWEHSDYLSVLQIMKDFVEGRKSDMLRMRLTFNELLEAMHSETLARHSSLKTREDENEAHEQWCLAQASHGKRQKKTGPLMPCPCCDA